MAVSMMSSMTPSEGAVESCLFKIPAAFLAAPPPAASSACTHAQTAVSMVNVSPTITTAAEQYQIRLLTCYIQILLCISVSHLRGMYGKFQMDPPDFRHCCQR